MSRSAALVLSLFVLVLSAGVSEAQYEAGACCFEDGSCVILSLAECYGAPGASHWVGNVPCDPGFCQTTTPWLACCLPDGTCSVLNYLECGAAGGMYQWWGGCDPSPCEEHLRACCLADGSCNLLIPSVCEYLGGQPLLETTCAPDPCLLPLGACCFVFPECVISSFDACHNAEGSYAWIADQPCDPNPCPNTPIVACCFADGRCEHIPEFMCEGQGGLNVGYWIDCDPYPCVPTPVEVGSWGRIKRTYR